MLRWGTPVALAALSLLIAWRAVGGKHADLHVPLLYSGDGLLILTLIKRLMENAWIFHSSSMGFPFGSTLYDYPIPDTGSLLALKLFGVITGSAGLAFNIYYFIGFPINALLAYAVFRNVSISRHLSAAGAFVFTILPFHFLRLGHLFYTWYFPSPCFVWFALRIFSGDMNFFDPRQNAARSVIDIAALMLLSCFGVYYSCFGVIAMVTAGAARCAWMHSFRPAGTSIVAAVVVTLGIAINVAPNIAYRLINGADQETAQRSPAESETYGLKISQLLLPRPEHRSEPLAEFNHSYSASFPLVNENAMSPLGMIGAAGFLALLAGFFFPTRVAPRRQQFYLLSLITLSLLLFCTIGGFSSLFSILISPLIRAWNRVSVFIGFTSIFGALLVIDAWLNKYRSAVIATTLISSTLAVVAIWDQTTPPCDKCAAANLAQFQNDADFVAAIGKVMPAGAAIYVLPYVRFPEAPPQNRLGSYDLARGYLQSTTFKWSYGPIKGRLPDLFLRALAEQPMELQIAIIRRLGFSAIYLDKRGYADNAAAIVGRLTHILGTGPVAVSKSSDQLLFDLRSLGPIEQLPPGESAEAIMRRAHFVVDRQGLIDYTMLHERIDFSREALPKFLSGVRGLSVPETWGRWSDANMFPYVELRFAQSLPKRFVVHLRVRAFGPNADKPVRVVVGTKEEAFMPTSGIDQFSLYFDNTAGSNVMEIHSAQPTSPSDLGMSSDVRRLGVGLEALSIEAVQ
ncbi:phosphoglycerol transferase [Trinickia symbiotica]|nr:phosphoglycerol transferase [Trinickia symbiotica]